MFKKLRKNEKGFTLAELLIVVAIIGVLVAISIPIFTSQLEKSREAVDEANIRSAYAEVMSAALTDSKKAEGKVQYTGTTYSEDVVLTQKVDGWATGITNIGGVTVDDSIAKVGGTVTVSFDTSGTSTNATIAPKK